ncbi:MAG: polar amino acid transport system permease protein [Desulforhopalus sp.]|jgi:polar amino acid transport system permease protein
MQSHKPAIKPLDVIVLAAIIGLFTYICYRLFFSLNYNWNWSVIPTYMVHHDLETGHWRANLLLEGFITTIKLSIWATLLATVIGFIVGLMRVSPRLFFRLIGRTYIEAIRNTPPLVLVFIFYYFVSDQFFTFLGVEDFFRASSPKTQQYLSFFFATPSLITQFLSGILTLAMFQGAYIAEIVRAGIQAVEIGQWEAGQAIGLNRWKTMRFIVLPQAIKIMLPPLANEFINTIKWSSIVSIISIQELTFQALQVMASTQATIEIWLTISTMYLVLCLSLSLFVRKIENRLARSEGVMSTYQQTGP